MHRGPPSTSMLGARSPSLADFSPRTPGTPCSSRRISMGEVTKARGTSIGGCARRVAEKEEEKKGAEMAPHVQRVFGASSGAVGKLISFLFLPTLLHPFSRSISPASLSPPLAFGAFCAPVPLFYFPPLPHPTLPALPISSRPRHRIAEGKKRREGRSQNAKLGLDRIGR